MIFSSNEFLFLFLPIALAGFFILGRLRQKTWAMGFIVSMSLLYYGWWNPKYLALIIVSIGINFLIGSTLASQKGRSHYRKVLLATGVLANLAAIAYFKYANFFVDNVNQLFGGNYQIDQIILPLAISFFTFQQITYLVDSYRGQTRNYNFLHYCLFVTFFPQLIAGPIVHHKEMMPQFRKESTYTFNFDLFTPGFVMFFLGLFKKVVIADTIGLNASRLFSLAESGTTLGFIDSWHAALGYTFQLYFDFSGYSDMAIGIGLMFGIKLPLNFNSPYRATNIIEFWRRWHITLSRFLRDYLYIPLGGSRKGKPRRYINLLVTMVLGGLWHGAGWTFIIWGALHGTYLVLNHAWRGLRQRLGHDLKSPPTIWGSTLGLILTFLVVVVGWVFFKANNLGSALTILGGMSGLNGWDGVQQLASLNSIMLLACFAIVWGLPNTQVFMRYVENPKEECLWVTKFRFSNRIGYAIFVSGVIFIGLIIMQSEMTSEFLYYDF